MNNVHIVIGLSSMIFAIPAMGAWRNQSFDSPTEVVTLSAEQFSDDPVDWVSFTQDLSQNIQMARSRANAPLGLSRLSILSQQPQFQGMDSNAIQSRISSINLAVIDSIDLIATERPSAAESLLRMLMTDRLGLGFGGKPGLRSELREDGSRTVGDEALNLYDFPISQDPIPIYSIDMFRLTSTLAREGFRLERGGFSGFVPIASVSAAAYRTNEAMEALQTQGREMEAATAEVVRINAILGALDGIISSGEVPSSSQGIAAAISYGLMRYSGAGLTEKQLLAQKMRAYLYGVANPAAYMDLEYRTAYYRAADAWLKGETSQSESFTLGLRESAYFHFASIHPSRPWNYVSYMAGYWPHANVLNTPQLDPQIFPPIILAGNEFRQIGASADGLSQTQRVFNVSGLKNITGALMWGTSLWLAGNSADNVNGAIWAYKDSNNDGLFDEGTASKAIELPEFKGGITFGRNTAGGLPFVLNRSTGNLYRLAGIVSDQPTTYSFYGRISSRTDIREFAFSGKYVYGMNDWDRPLTRGVRWSVAELLAGSFQPLGDHYEPYNYAELVPALGSSVRGGALDIYLTGTAGRQVTAYDINNVTSPIGSIDLDPAGRGVLHLEDPLTAGHGLRFTDDQGMQSATYEIPAWGPLRFAQPQTLSDGNLRFQAFGMPGKPHTVLSSPNLDDWEEDECVKSSRFGSMFFIRDPSMDSAFYDIRREDYPLMARSDTYTMAPGVKASLYVGYNDHVRMDTTYQLAGPTGYHPDLISLSTKGVLSFGALADVSQFQVYYNLNAAGGATSQVARITINIDTNLLLNPPVMTNSLTGEPFVAVPCLVLGGLHYPSYQFAVRNSPLDVCTEPHWHRWPGIISVYPLEIPNQGIGDPLPGSCGFGTYETVAQEDFLQTPEGFKAFKTMHPRP